MNDHENQGLAKVTDRTVCGRMLGFLLRQCSPAMAYPYEWVVRPGLSQLAIGVGIRTWVGCGAPKTWQAAVACRVEESRGPIEGAPGAADLADRLGPDGCTYLAGESSVDLRWVDGENFGEATIHVTRRELEELLLGVLRAHSDWRLSR